MFLYYTVFIILTLNIITFAQDEDYQKWLERQQKEYTKHLADEDKAFSNFLLKNWKTFEVKEENPVETKPKPVIPPVLDPVDQNSPLINRKDDKTVVVITNNNPTKNNKKEENENNEIKEENFSKQSIPANSSNIEFNFYGADFSFIVPNELPNIKLNRSVSKESIGKFWENISTVEYDNLLKDFLGKSDKHNLNGWAYCKMLNFTAHKVYPILRNERQLFIWFMLNKSGYQSRVGISDNKVYLLLPFTHTIFDVPFFTINGSDNKMYVIDFDDLRSVTINDIVTYDGDYSKSNSILELGIKKPINITENFSVKNLEFTYRDTTYKFPVKYDEGLLRFFFRYPYTNLPVYFSSPVSEVVKKSLINGLNPIIKNKPLPEAVNILLHFVQTAFGYKLDEEQFKCEKPMFIEETVIYSYCDCEDRAVLFSFLVRELLGLEVIGLDYPGHVASAVRFNENVPGDYINYNGDKYIICDPTYINANIGMSMDVYKNTKPLEIIVTGK